VHFSPARLKLDREIPVGRSWLYEPKFDGYRGMLMTNRAGQAVVYSRNAKDLGRCFPELLQVAQALPAGTVIDGEIVAPSSFAR